MRASYHTHIAAAGIDAMVMAASARRMSVLGVCERLEAIALGERLREYEAQVRFAAGPGVRVRLGVEVDFLPQTAAESATLLTRTAWDFVLTGVHAVDGVPLHRLAAASDLAQGWSVWRRYCALQEAAVRSGLADALVHPLRLARHLPPPPYLGQLLEPVLEAARERRVAIELHGGDWAWQPALQARLAMWAHAQGVRVCLGAGAHLPDEIDRHLEGMAGALRRAGYMTVSGFCARRVVTEALPHSPPRWDRNWATGMR